MEWNKQLNHQIVNDRVGHWIKHKLLRTARQRVNDLGCEWSGMEQTKS